MPIPSKQLNSDNNTITMPMPQTLAKGMPLPNSSRITKEDLHPSTMTASMVDAETTYIIKNILLDHRLPMLTTGKSKRENTAKPAIHSVKFIRFVLC